MIEVELSRIIIDEKRQDQVIVLRDKESQRQIPIVIGFMEASSIKIMVSGVDVERPLTHDLFINLTKTLKARITRVLIDAIVESTFYAKIEIAYGRGKKALIDARPSDSIAIAVKAKVPIFIDEDVLRQAALPQL